MLFCWFQDLVHFLQFPELTKQQAPAQYLAGVKTLAISTVQASGGTIAIGWVAPPHLFHDTFRLAPQLQLRPTLRLILRIVDAMIRGAESADPSGPPGCEGYPRIIALPS